MFMAKVVGNVVATRKEESLVGYKLLIIRRMNAKQEEDKEEQIAADYVGAGIGDCVIIGQGSAVRVNPAKKNAAIDLAVIGIIDTFD